MKKPPALADRPFLSGPLPPVTHCKTHPHLTGRRAPTQLADLKKLSGPAGKFNGPLGLFCAYRSYRFQKCTNGGYTACWPQLGHNTTNCCTNYCAKTVQCLQPGGQWQPVVPDFVRLRLTGNLVSTKMPPNGLKFELGWGSLFAWVRNLNSLGVVVPPDVWDVNFLALGHLPPAAEPNIVALMSLLLGNEQCWSVSEPVPTAPVSCASFTSSGFFESCTTPPHHGHKQPISSRIL